MVEEIDKEKFNELLEGFSKLKFKERKNPTFLEIIKQPARETAWSNILAFYFDPHREHNLKNLMLKSFFEALGKEGEIKNYDGIKVLSEFSTDSRKRIDLVITGNNFVLGIENKVDYWLHNDLEDYSRKIDRLASENGKDCIPFKVILSKNHYHDERGFVNLTYDSFIKSIKKNLPDYKASANPKYLTFLNDFLKNIKNTIKFKDMIENEKSLEYFQNNYDSIEQLTIKFLKFKDEVRIKFCEIHSAIDLSKLNADFRMKYGIEASIHKDGIWDQEDDNRFPIFSIFIENSKKIEYLVYVEEQMRFIYCYGFSDDESYKEILQKSKNFELPIEISDETKEAAHKITNKIIEIIDNIFAD